MKHNISYHIRYLLREEGQLYVPGIGMFSLDFRSATIDVDRQTINPPALDLNFSGSSKDDSNLSEKIAIRENKEKDSVDREVTQFTNDLIQKLVDDQKAEIEGLGTLYSKRGKVHFIPASNSIKPEYDWLKSIKLNPVNRFKQSFKAIDLPPKETLKVDLMPILFGFIGGLMMIGLFLLFGWLTSDSRSTPTHISIQENLPIINDTVEVDHQEEDPSYILNDYDQFIPNSGKCVIITGSLTKFKNVIEMEALLNDKGYTVYSANYHEMTRVGIQFDCTDIDLVKYIQKIRSEISSDAWYLDPELEVRY